MNKARRVAALKHRRKEKKLKEDMNRDIQGWDDVVAQKLAELDKAPLEPADTDAKDEKKGKSKKEKKKTEEDLLKEREDQKKAIVDDAEKKKQAIRDQFAPDFEKHEPRKQRAIREAKEMAQKRKEKADKAVQECLSENKTAGLSAEVAACRINAKSQKDWAECQ